MKEKNYILYDEEYLGQGVFFITRSEEGITKFFKLYENNMLGFPVFSITGYEVGAYDRSEQEERHIDFKISESDSLYKTFKSFYDSLSSKQIFTIDDINYGRNRISLSEGNGFLNVRLTKEVYRGRQNMYNSVDVFLGDSYTCLEYQSVLDLYNDLLSVCERQMTSSEVKEILTLRK